ncbi:hypothetical protein BJ165DRAFT_1515994 [Panaeolus papilionaceus]|nr:hypothetical protein BJ165DRAFT_1515994 [Panaeolus papilionaceus]
MTSTSDDTTRRVQDLKGKGKAREVDATLDEEPHNVSTMSRAHEEEAQSASGGSSLQHVATGDREWGQQLASTVTSLSSIPTLGSFGRSSAFIDSQSHKTFTPEATELTMPTPISTQLEPHTHHHKPSDPLCTSCTTLLSHLHTPLTSPFTHLLSKTTRHIPRTSSEEHSIHTVISTGLSRITEIEQAESKLKALMNDLKREKRKVEAWVDDHRVMIAPVWTLPPEVLSEIFVRVVGFDDGSWDELEYSTAPDEVLTLPSSTSGTTPTPADREREKRARGEITRASIRSSVRLSWVCRQWRDVALHTPQLWTRICVVELPPPEELGELRKKLGLGTVDAGTDAKASQKRATLEALEASFVTNPFVFANGNSSTVASSSDLQPNPNTNTNSSSDALSPSPPTSTSPSSASKLPMPLIALLRTGTSLPLDLHFRTSKPRDIIDYFLPVKSRWRRVVFDASVGVGVMMRVLSGEVHVGEVNARRRRISDGASDEDRWKVAVDARGEVRRVPLGDSEREGSSEDESSEGASSSSQAQDSQSGNAEGSPSGEGGSRVFREDNEREKEVRFPMLESLEFRGVPTPDLRETGWVVGEVWRPPVSVIAGGSLAAPAGTANGNANVAAGPVVAPAIAPTAGVIAAPIPVPAPTPNPLSTNAPAPAPSTADTTSATTTSAPNNGVNEAEVTPAADGEVMEDDVGSSSTAVATIIAPHENAEVVEGDGLDTATSSSGGGESPTGVDEATSMTVPTIEVVVPSTSSSSTGTGSPVETTMTTTSTVDVAVADAGSSRPDTPTQSTEDDNDIGITVVPEEATTDETTPVASGSGTTTSVRSSPIPHPKLNPLTLFTPYHAPNLTALCSVQMFGIAYTMLPLSQLRRYEGPLQVGDYVRLLNMMPLLEELFVQPLRSAGGGLGMGGLGGGMIVGPHPIGGAQPPPQLQPQMQPQGPAAGAPGPPFPNPNNALASLLETESSATTPPHLHLQHLHISSSSIASTLSFSLMAGGGGPPWLLTQLQHLPPLPSLTKLFLYFDKRFIPPQPERTLYPFFEKNGASLKEIVWGLSLGVESVKRCLEKSAQVEVLHVHRICGDALLRALVIDEERENLVGKMLRKAAATPVATAPAAVTSPVPIGGPSAFGMVAMINPPAVIPGPSNVVSALAATTAQPVPGPSTISTTNANSNTTTSPSTNTNNAGLNLDVNHAIHAAMETLNSGPSSGNPMHNPSIGDVVAELSRRLNMDSDAQMREIRSRVAALRLARTNSSVAGGSGSTSGSEPSGAPSTTPSDAHRESTAADEEETTVTTSEDTATSVASASGQNSSATNDDGPVGGAAVNPPADFDPLSATTEPNPATTSSTTPPPVAAVTGPQNASSAPPSPELPATSSTTPSPIALPSESARPILLPNLRIVLRVEMLEKVVWSRCAGGRDGKMRNVVVADGDFAVDKVVEELVKKDVKGKGKARAVDAGDNLGLSSTSGSLAGQTVLTGETHIRSRSGSDDAGSDEDKIPPGGERREDGQNLPWLLRGIQSSSDVSGPSSSSQVMMPVPSTLRDISPSDIQSLLDDMNEGARILAVQPQNQAGSRPQHPRALHNKSKERIVKMGGVKTGMVVIVRQRF